MQTAQLDQIVRQRDRELLKAVEHLSKNETAMGVQMLQQQGRVTEIVDRVQFTAPNKELGAANRDLGTIQSIDGDRNITVRMDGNENTTVKFDPANMRHFDHGYAVTSHSSQGLTSERVLVNMDTNVHPELINTRFAYVSVSRASQDVQIFTNDAATLAESLSRDVTKASALDFVKAQNPVGNVGLEPAAAVKIAPAAGLGLGL